MRDSSATEDITACSSLRNAEIQLHPVSQPPHGCIASAHFQPLGQILPWEFLFLHWSLSWPVALFWWCVPLPLPPCSWVKCCFYWLQWGSCYWETRNPITTLFLRASSQGCLELGGGCLLGSKGGATGCDSRTLGFGSDNIVSPLSTYFKFPNLNCTAYKTSIKQHNLLYIWGKSFHS